MVAKTITKSLYKLGTMPWLRLVRLKIAPRRTFASKLRFNLKRRDVGPRLSRILLEDCSIFEHSDEVPIHKSRDRHAFSYLQRENLRKYEHASG
jgi:hypothetical protein